MKAKFVLPFVLTLTLNALAQQQPGKAPPQAADPFQRTGLEPLPGEPPPAKPSNVYGLVEYIEVPREAWLSYSAANPVGIDASALRAEVQGWIAAKKAKPIELTCVPTKSGQRMVVESIIEQRYPTEYYQTTPLPVPSSFETRNIHFAFEWEPISSPDSKTVDSSFVPWITRLTGYTFHTPMQRKVAERGDANSPLIATQKTTVSISSRANLPALLDVTTPFDDSGNLRDDVRCLAFFRAAPVPVAGSERPSESTYDILQGNSRVKMTQKQVDDLLNDRSEDPAAVRRRDAVRAQVEKAEATIRTAAFMFEIERLEVTLADLNAWFAGKDLEAATSGLRKSAREWIQGGRGREVDRRTGPVKSGNRSVLESVFEIRYPTEFAYDPAVAPTTFETRNTGYTIELEPVLSADGKMVDVSIVPQDTRYCGKVVVHRAAFEGKMVPSIEQPIFATMRVSTNISTAVGQYSLLAINTPVNDNMQPDPQRRILTFITFRQ